MGAFRLDFQYSTILKLLF